MDTRLGDRGVGLSVGERQRVGLARAFLRQAPLLLLDEPTANLDGATEDEVLADLRRVLRGRTALLVAHRPALVALADRVLELGELAVAA
jgi:ABC-type multidrug transport system fused ATPase/permease subunit